MTIEQLLAAVNAKLKANGQNEMTADDLVDFIYRSVLQMRVIRSNAQIAAGRAAAQQEMRDADEKAQAEQAANDARQALIAAV